ncbi:hypothetical protein JVU11DRAFT_2075 [Chiua virens]|nr:hypothetical protein JVU11DRAFT_2075 [Chiua virens]
MPISLESHLPLNGDTATVPSLLLDKPSRFSLDNAGVLGLIGGNDAMSAMATVHVYGNRRWLGWYNNPGSFQIAKRLRAFAPSASLCGVFNSCVSLSHSAGSIHTDPTALFELDRCKGPKFRAAHSGTAIPETGYLAALLMKACAAWSSEGNVVPGRKTQPVEITIVDLGEAPASEVRPARASVSTLFFASLPISASVGACAAGLSCLILGSADLVFTHPEPAKGSPAGDGILTSDKDIVLLKGTEGAVNSITRGNISLRFSGEGHYGLLRWCSLLFTVQAVTQLLLISQASLFGQVMFLASFGVSAIYNARISSMDKEKIHQKLLFEDVFQNPMLTKYTLGTRTTAVVFILLVLGLQDPTGLLDELLPNDTKVWRQWKAMILEQLRHRKDEYRQFGAQGGDLNGFTEQEKNLLNTLLEDARAAYNGYCDYLRADSL